MQLVIRITALLSVIIACALCSDRVTFYSYGPGVGDSRLISSANPSKTLTLLEPYMFYGEDYSTICLSDNGYLTFQYPLLSNKPKPFPIKIGMETAKRAMMIAPYWSDVDTRCGGNIYYRQLKVFPGSDLYYKIQKEVGYTGLEADFKPSSVLIVTWEGVTTTNNVPCTDQRRNSIQFVLTTDGMKTFVMYRYKILEWSGPQSSTPSSLPHMETGPATAGVNAGDTVNGYNVTNDPDNIIHLRLVNMSNVEPSVSGLFIYRIDLGTSARVRTYLMGKMMEAVVAETMQFGTAEHEEDLYSPYAHIAASEFNRQPFAHHEEYVASLTANTQDAALYPYGEDDANLGNSDEGMSGIEYLPKAIPFYGKNYKKYVVYADGFITLGDYYPSDFPAFVPRILKTTDVPIIAPYFADADPSKSGKVYFRVTSDSSLLERAAKDVELVFSNDNFSPEQLLIATWEEIGFYHQNDNLVNTYQAIIASDSHTSYVIFIYKKVEWSSPDNTGVTPGSGLNAEPSKLPVMGISDGTGCEQLVSGSSEPRNEQNILSVETNPGNTKVPGVWIFQATAHPQTNVNIQSPQFVDPKMQYSEYHRPSRPYLDHHDESELESLASELQNAKNHLG